jgi:tetraacyldisaccharide 4'-kinase
VQRRPLFAAARRVQDAWRTRGPLAVALLPLAAIHAALGATRRLLYRIGWLRTCHLAVPVVVVGNLVAGGAGKTPTVIALVELLRHHRYTPGIVSRGYGRRGAGLLEVRADTTSEECGDEPKLLHTRTAAPVLVGRDRVRAARELLRLHPEVDIVVSDDGLQHLALGRNAQVIVFDERGVGNGWLLPAGPLREPLASTPPARTLVLYNAATLSTAWPGALAQRGLAGVAALSDWWQGRPAVPGVVESLRGRQLLAVAGIASPQRFFDLLHDQGLACETLALPDHDAYLTLPWPATAQDVIVTEKDAVKIDPRRVGSTRVWVATLDFRTTPSFDSALIDILRSAPPRGAVHGSPSA